MNEDNNLKPVKHEKEIKYIVLISTIILIVVGIILTLLILNK